MQPIAPGQPIPQSVLDRYNACYDNDTYRVFRDKLQAVAAENPAYGEAFIGAVLNLLSDSALERSGAEDYTGREHSLMQLIRHRQDLVVLAWNHLANFGPLPKSFPLDQTDRVRYMLMDAQACAEEATRAAGEIRSWRGHIAFAWASAASYLLHAASAMLVESHYDSYPLEKFDKALAQVRHGVSEAKDHDVAMAGDFVIWMQRLVKSRD